MREILSEFLKEKGIRIALALFATIAAGFYLLINRGMASVILWTNVALINQWLGWQLHPLMVYFVLVMIILGHVWFLVLRYAEWIEKYSRPHAK